MRVSSAGLLHLCAMQREQSFSMVNPAYDEKRRLGIEEQSYTLNKCFRQAVSSFLGNIFAKKMKRRSGRPFSSLVVVVQSSFSDFTFPQQASWHVCRQHGAEGPVFERQRLSQRFADGVHHKPDETPCMLDCCNWPVPPLSLVFIGQIGSLKLSFACRALMSRSMLHSKFPTLVM